MDRHRLEFARLWLRNPAAFATVLFLIASSSCRMSGVEPALYCPPPGDGLEVGRPHLVRDHGELRGRSISGLEVTGLEHHVDLRG